MQRRRQKAKNGGKSGTIVTVVIVLSITVIFLSYISLNGHHTQTKPVILYINQGNGRVNESNFGEMLTFASAKGFNTIFFQIYYKGIPLFNSSQLDYFVNVTHAAEMKIFFALSFTNDSQRIPNTIYNLGENGINLDMSTLDRQGQTNLLSTLQSNYHNGITAVTTYDFSTALKPDWLILETYGIQDQSYIHKGIIGSVGVFATSNKQDYQEQFSYALRNSDGVMVFDYYGLVNSGY